MEQEIKEALIKLGKLEYKIDRFLNKRKYKLDFVKLKDKIVEYHRKFYVVGIIDNNYNFLDNLRVKNNFGNTIILNTQGILFSYDVDVNEHWLNEVEAEIEGDLIIDDDTKATYAIVYYVDN